MFSKIYHTYVRTYANARNEAEMDVGRRFALFIMTTAILIAGTMLVNMHVGLLVFLLVVPTFYNFAVNWLQDYKGCNCNAEQYAQYLKVRFRRDKRLSMATTFFLICLINAAMMALSTLSLEVPVLSFEFALYNGMLLFGMYSIIPILANVVMLCDMISGSSVVKIGFVEKWLSKHYKSE